MQFGREPMPGAAAAASQTGAPGWNCTDQAAHFQRASQPQPPARSQWDDDGGAQKSEGRPVGR